MTAKANKAPANKPVGTEVVKTGAKPPYPFRTGISLILLAGTILVAGIYFQLINP
jgi:photosystem I protein